MSRIIRLEAGVNPTMGYPRDVLGALVVGLTVGASVFVTPADAKKMVDAGAVVIDARENPKPPFLPSAQPLDWMSLRDGFGRTGKLADTETLIRALEAIGVRNDRPVLVYGAADQGWGEEGRIWWMLRYLGHAETRILDGGIHAWRVAGHAVVKSRGKPKRGRFTAKIDTLLRADHNRVNRIRKAPNGQVIDTRTLDEFRGATPYWAFRGGHVPGAVHVRWRSLLDARGRALPRDALKKRLAAFGLSAERPTVTYCTGGVRSAFVVAALVEAGFEDVANYDGSWWDWASRTELPAETE